MKEKHDEFWNDDMLEDEIFGLIHRAIACINEQRGQDDKIEVFDQEIGIAAHMLISTEIRSVLNRRILDEYDNDIERYADVMGGVE